MATYLTKRSIGWLALVAIALAAAAMVAWHVDLRWRATPEVISSRMLEETPLGSSEALVLDALAKQDRKPAPMWRGVIAPGSDYPLTTRGGSSFTHVVLAQYGIVFTTSVEAFYIFDSNQRLIEVGIRKTTDAF